MTTPTSIPSPIDEARRVGTVIVATPGVATINLPNASNTAPLVHHGEQVHRGQVGEYVCFARQDIIVLGRITRVQLPERDRLKVEPRIGSEGRADPVGTVSLLTDIDLRERRVTGVVTVPPKLGAPAYSVPATFLVWIMEIGSGGGDSGVVLCIGDVAGSGSLPVRVTPDKLFGRHCAILGTTGAGKSWTIARLVEECSKLKSKVILVDATGEFRTFVGDGVQHLSLGSSKDEPGTSIEVGCPYDRLEERDLFALFSPSAQSQAPLLREAIRSLKLAKCSGLPANLVDATGLVNKSGRKKADFLAACKTHAAVIESPRSPFNVHLLSNQIERECVYPSGDFGRDDSVWGGVDPKMVGYCISLIMRIEAMLKEASFGPMFAPIGGPVQEAIDKFLKAKDSVLRISLRFLSTVQSLRPVVVNAIGRHLLDLARAGEFGQRPTVVVLDEAHQFLGKTIGADEAVYAMDAFDIVAKEGRKYGLTLCLATQRPRDIQDGVLSQIGTMLVHRLTHGGDREVVERATRDVEKSVAEFLPALGPGQALLLGTDFPIPIPIQVRAPGCRPASDGPDYQAHWKTDEQWGKELFS